MGAFIFCLKMVNFDCFYLLIMLLDMLSVPWFLGIFEVLNFIEVK